MDTDDRLELDPGNEMLDCDTTLSAQQPTIFGQTQSNRKALACITSTFEDIVAALNSDPPGEVKIVLRRVTRVEHKHVDDMYQGSTKRDDSRGNFEVVDRQVKYGWPGKNEKECWRFACLLSILGEIRTAILTGTMVTKRDIFYRDPELFGKQATVDRYIGDIAYTYGVTRKDLRVIASPKGLICGLDPNDGIQTVPGDIENITAAGVSRLRWILVVEKDASFKSLVEDSFHFGCSLGPGLLVTAKGYPDLSTRLFLRHILGLSSRILPVPIFGLFDGDPDGLEIHRCYHSGSKNLIQEAAANLPELIWLGVDLCEFVGQGDVMDRTVMLTGRDRKKAVGMLARTEYSSVGSSARGVRVRKMLQVMLMLNKKAEIQALGGMVGGYCGWLDRKMRMSE